MWMCMYACWFEQVIPRLYLRFSPNYDCECVCMHNKELRLWMCMHVGLNKSSLDCTCGSVRWSLLCRNYECECVCMPGESLSRFAVPTASVYNVCMHNTGIVNVRLTNWTRLRFENHLVWLTFWFNVWIVLVRLPIGNEMVRSRNCCQYETYSCFFGQVIPRLYFSWGAKFEAFEHMWSNLK